MKYVFTLIALLILCPGTLLAAGQPASDLGMKSFGVAVLFIAVLAAFAWALKTYGPAARIRKTSGLDIVGRVPLGPKAGLALVRVGKNLLLLGVTQDQVTLVKDLGEDSFEKAMGTQLDDRRGGA
ncbi:MAG: flagellar biosynthetic protein FliO [Syntrophaceae bacterium]